MVCSTPRTALAVGAAKRTIRPCGRGLASHTVAPAVSATLQFLGALGMTPEQQYAFLNQMVNRQAFTLSALDLFYGSALLLVALIPLLWIARPARRDTGEDVASAH